ncbi:amidohydrolase family protein [Mameliella alba]|nr:amidohydrolase family protein [Mameliella alba]MBY6171129.1 amidohydrolase family protein [Mameliella alba]MBY6176353.1 amidohydrolase family protein [Mameliella alba]
MAMNAPTRQTETLTGLALAGRSGTWDMTLGEGRIVSLQPSQQTGGGFVMPPMADIHVHLDKTFTIDRMPRRATSLFDAIDMMSEDAQRWTADDLLRRAGGGLSRAFAHGTAVMRSHVDWLHPEAPAAWPVLCELAQHWQGRVALQLASLSPLDDLAEIGPTVAKAVRAAGGVLGAFVYRNDDLERKVAGVFDLAETYGLDLDFHVDEGVEPEARGIDAIIAETARRGMGGHVLCGHGCALSVRPPDDVARVLEQAAAAGVGLTVLPGANSYLQDGGTGRTPRLRGLAPMHEARAAGVPVMIGSDNVRDGFYPYGDYDLWDVYRLAVLNGHLPHDDWLDAISDTPARWLGRDLSLREGGPASFIRFDATGPGDALSRAGTPRDVWHNGTRVPGFQGETS